MDFTKSHFYTNNNYWYSLSQRTKNSFKRQIKEIETPLGKLQVKEVEIDGEKDVIQNMKVLKN